METGHRSVLCYHGSTAGKGGWCGSDGPVTSGDERGGWRERGEGGGREQRERERERLKGH